jgi:Fe-S oxidoreductase
VLAKFVDGELEEFDTNGADAPCCGGPSHYHVVAREASERCATDRVEQLDREGGDAIVCASATCKKSFRRAGNHGALDLLEIVCRAMGF